MNIRDLIGNYQEPSRSILFFAIDILKYFKISIKMIREKSYEGARIAMLFNFTWSYFIVQLEIIKFFNIKMASCVWIIVIKSMEK